VRRRYQHGQPQRQQLLWGATTGVTNTARTICSRAYIADKQPAAAYRVVAFARRLHLDDVSAKVTQGGSCKWPSENTRQIEDADACKRSRRHRGG
jgi:hypothetical protein